METKKIKLTLNFGHKKVELNQEESSHPSESGKCLPPPAGKTVPPMPEEKSSNRRQTRSQMSPSSASMDFPSTSFRDPEDNKRVLRSADKDHSVTPRRSTRTNGTTKKKSAASPASLSLNSKPKYTVKRRSVSERTPVTPKKTLFDDDALLTLPAKRTTRYNFTDLKDHQPAPKRPPPPKPPEVVTDDEGVRKRVSRSEPVRPQGQMIPIITTIPLQEPRKKRRIDESDMIRYLTECIMKPGEHAGNDLRIVHPLSAPVGHQGGSPSSARSGNAPKSAINGGQVGMAVSRRKKMNGAGISNHGTRYASNLPLPQSQVMYTNEVCDCCHFPGTLICCDKCPRAYHIYCADPPVRDESQEDWVCKSCRWKKQEQPRYSNIVWGKLLTELDKQNPAAYRLPETLECYFRFAGVDPDSGAFVDLFRARSLRKHFAPTRDISELKDSEGKIRLCYRCSDSALKGYIITCDYCGNHFHWDCLQPPLSSSPPPHVNWMCPLHSDHHVPRPVKLHHDVQVRLDSWRPTSGGDIRVELRPWKEVNLEQETTKQSILRRESPQTKTENATANEQESNTVAAWEFIPREIEEAETSAMTESVQEEDKALSSMKTSTRGSITRSAESKAIANRRQSDSGVKSPDKDNDKEKNKKRVQPSPRTRQQVKRARIDPLDLSSLSSSTRGHTMMTPHSAYPKTPPPPAKVEYKTPQYKDGDLTYPAEVMDSYRTFIMPEETLLDAFVGRIEENVDERHVQFLRKQAQRMLKVADAVVTGEANLKILGEAADKEFRKDEIELEEYLDLPCGSTGSNRSRGGRSDPDSASEKGWHANGRSNSGDSQSSRSIQERTVEEETTIIPPSSSKMFDGAAASPICTKQFLDNGGPAGHPNGSLSGSDMEAEVGA